MIIDRNDNEVVFRISGDINIDDLQEFADLFEFIEISGKSKATQKEVDKLVKNVKKGRWDKTNRELGL
jgi:hypothetical protein